MAESNRYTVTKLGLTNYFTWRVKIKLLLIRDGLWEVIEKPPPTNNPEQWYKKDNMAKATIGLMIEDELMINIRDCDTAKDMLTQLKDTFENSSYGTQVALMRKLFNTKYVPGSPMLEHINSIRETNAKLTDMGEVMSEKILCAALLGSLPNEYGNLITAIEGRPNADIKFSFIQAQMLEEAKRRNEDITTPNNSTNKTLFVKSTPNPRYRPQPKCFHCGRIGHIRRDCRQLNRTEQHRDLYEENYSNTSPNNKAQFPNTKGTSQEGVNFTVLSCSIGNKSSRNKWIIDSGATRHTSGIKQNYFNLKYIKDNLSVETADGTKVKVTGIGDLKWNTLDVHGVPQCFILRNALYTPGIEQNLISVRELTKNNTVVYFENNNIILKTKEKGIFTLPMKKEQEQNQVQNTTCQVKNCIHKWHEKLGHPSFRRIITMKNQNLVRGMRIQKCDHNDLCETCIQSKLSTNPFPKTKVELAKRPFDLLHVDICGPMSHISMGGNKYVLTITDDHSRYTTIYLLSEKSQATSHIINFIEENKNRFNYKPQALRSDSGGEFINNTLERYLLEQGIVHQRSIVYSPSQNGVAERVNRTLIESVRCILLQAHQKHSLWAEAFNYSNHTKNRTITRSHGRTPYELWFKKTPSLHYLKTFGEKCYYLIPSRYRHKLDPTAHEGILVGYLDRSRGYRILSNTNQIIASRSVIFTGEFQNYTQNPTKTEEVLTYPSQTTESFTESEIPLDDELSNENLEDSNVINNNIEPPRRSNRTTKGIPAKRYKDYMC